MDENEEIFTPIPETFRVRLFLDDLHRVRRDLYLDPLLAEPWSCDPERCRPHLGKNLCCKVEVRCVHLHEDRCAIHPSKPLSCALFPLDLVRVGGVRVVTTVSNLDFFDTGWSRYDRDMLRCFDGMPAVHGMTMFEAQKGFLLRVMTRSEVFLMEKAIQSLRVPKIQNRQHKSAAR